MHWLWSSGLVLTLVPHHFEVVSDLYIITCRSSRSSARTSESFDHYGSDSEHLWLGSLCHGMLRGEGKPRITFVEFTNQVAEFKPFLAYKMVILGEVFMSATTVLRSATEAVRYATVF